MELLEIIDERSCAANLQSKHKAAAMEELAALISGSLTEISREKILSALQEREEVGSTGLENGVAIPHARIAGVKRFALGVGVSRRGIAFASVDGKRTHVFFVLVGPPEQQQEYLQALAQISRVGLNQNAYAELLKAPTPLAVKESVLRFVRPGRARVAKRKPTKLVFIVLYEQRYLDEIVTLFLERGIQGASIFESRGIKNILTRVPLFGDLLNFLGERSDTSQTIMTVLADDEVEPLVAGIEEIMGDLDTHSGAAVFATDLTLIKGSMQVM